MRLDRESASRFECRLRDVVSGTGPFGKPCPVSSRNSGTQFPSEVPWGKSDPEFAWIVGRTFRRAVPPQLRRVATRCITTCKSATLVQHASVAQGIEHRSPKAGVVGRLSKRPLEIIALYISSSVKPSRERRRFWFVGAADGLGPSTPASPISPRGGEFSNPPGGTRDLPSPVPLRCRALLV